MVALLVRKRHFCAIIGKPVNWSDLKERLSSGYIPIVQFSDR